MQTVEPSPVARPASRISAEFLSAWPAFASTGALDRLRETEFSRLDEQSHVYLDFTGGGLYGASQVRRHAELLTSHVLGNPHSRNPTSRTATELVERCRRRVLELFRASPDEYLVIFTANASHALKLVGESYPFGPGDELLLTYDNHNSVNGIREFDRAHGAHTTYIPVAPPEMRVDDVALHRSLGRARPGRHNLFAYPAQSNFSGVQHPLEWIEDAQSRGWDVLLDAAAFVPTNRLDLSRWHPDFVALSFYKMFGYPTGVGALIGRREALRKLHRPWFAGGTIEVASVQADRYELASGAAAFEDGTLDYTSLPAVEIGLEFLEAAGLDVIHERVRCLTGWLLQRLGALRHGNGRPLARIYGPTGVHARGGAVAFNLFDAGGLAIDHRRVEERAADRMISLRTGCFCNPGAGELALGLTRGELETCFARTAMTYDDFRLCIDPRRSGAVRVSPGMISNLADVEAFLALAEDFCE